MRYKKAPTEDVAYILAMLGAICPISKELSTAFYEKTVSLKVKKDTILLKEGERCQYMYFIKRGAMMGQTIHQRKEIVTYISIDNEFVSSISGLHGVVPSQEAIIAVEDSELIAMHNDDLQELFSKYFDMNYLFRVMVEQYYRDAQERTHIIRVGNAKERYLYFVNTKPGYIERLPLHLVASMLDMKLQTLLRVQKQHQLSLQKDRETEDWCAKIEDYIITKEAFKTTDLSLEKVANTLSSSTHKLSAIFNNVYKMTFADFVNGQRIKSIQLQMANTEAMRNFTIEALAKQTGFASRSAFYNAFKKIVGVSPAEYRSALSSSSI
ncbi:helix-turn-helix domain-containing protein [Pedobacter nanyangensis]|uniref:helix-turn-helix domain-containing protein n=1 Tax=Pedobacter nanyangensis TaxID=1562389 RepID=UPI000DE4BD5C|nr:helix-turn-helix domain-containing protein [Pedobacter nanyangensis]